jgi:hypothetical protein
MGGEGRSRVVRVEAEIASGMNGSRGKARRLLADSDVATVVVEHKNRLGRMNVELVEAVFSAHGRRLVVLDDGEVEDDLMRDMVEVLTSLCARLYGWAGSIKMATITIVAVDPAYTSQSGAQHWQKPLTSKTRKTTRHDAAGIAIGRRALGHPIRRRTAPPHNDQSDRRGHRTVQTEPHSREREESRPCIPGQRTRSDCAECNAKAGDQCAQHRSGHAAEPVQLMLSL